MSKVIYSDIGSWYVNGRHKQSTSRCAERLIAYLRRGSTVRLSTQGRPLQSGRTVYLFKQWMNLVNSIIDPAHHLTWYEGRGNAIGYEYTATGNTVFDKCVLTLARYPFKAHGWVVRARMALALKRKFKDQYSVFTYLGVADKTVSKHISTNLGYFSPGNFGILPPTHWMTKETFLLSPSTVKNGVHRTFMGSPVSPELRASIYKYVENLDDPVIERFLIRN